METTEHIIARLILSTKRRVREFDLIQVADDIERLKNEMEGLKPVSEILEISEGMLNKFLKVKSTSPKIQKYVKSRVIDSVALVNELGKFSLSEQDILIDLIINKVLHPIDLRYLHPLRTKYIDISIEQLVNRLNESKNKKVSIIKFNEEDLHKPITELELALKNIVGEKELINLEINNKFGTIRITPKGEKILRDSAKRQRKTLQDFTYSILN